ncbi:MAG: hypothetical protein V4520_18450 [Bacteroidota bacterium]
MITQKLEDLYTQNLDRFMSVREILKDHNINGPYLCSPTDLYLNQKIKLLIIGQETAGWTNHDIKGQMVKYETFKVGKTHNSTFWQMARSLETAFDNTAYSCAALNLNKFDVAGHNPRTEVQIQPIRALDDIIVPEIKIINPNVCIFFTSHNSDYRLKNLYHDLKFIEIEGWNVKHLCILKHPNLPEYTFRAYHPNYLRRKGLESKVVAAIASHLL